MARGYYVETIGNTTEEAVRKYIKEQAEESRKKIREVPLYSGPVKCLRHRPYGRTVRYVLWRAKFKPPVELMVDNLAYQQKHIIEIICKS